jgi:hypothetical protein
MKAILALLFTLVAYVTAAAIDIDKDAHDLVLRAEDGDVVVSMLPDGRRKVDFFDDGVYQGYALETDAGGLCSHEFLPLPRIRH